MAGTGSDSDRVSVSYVGWSASGALLGVLVIELTAFLLQELAGRPLIISPQLGASAILVFGAPETSPAQPRNVLGGHVLAASIGVTAYRVLPWDAAIVAAVAVAVAMVAMQLARALHPPAGATALIAASQESVHALGYAYVLVPVLSGASVLVIVGLLFNGLSRDPRRHYPLYWW